MAHSVGIGVGEFGKGEKGDQVFKDWELASGNSFIQPRQDRALPSFERKKRLL
ncbi:hypothetical protein [Laspinema olomoucense]|uniref:hypothetical protein n=1 Tax=Laspinema olomoucense TaxID=3231600 RepID=UPI0021BAAC36|nr:hypothetical protein [Laspinema sp. D3c]MCT7995964.1 hypothetical protein [Laspinema sp. D3c]